MKEGRGGAEYLLFQLLQPQSSELIPQGPERNAGCLGASREAPAVPDPLLGFWPQMRSQNRQKWSCDPPSTGGSWTPRSPLVAKVPNLLRGMTKLQRNSPSARIPDAWVPHSPFLFYIRYSHETLWAQSEWGIRTQNQHQLPSTLQHPARLLQ